MDLDQVKKRVVRRLHSVLRNSVRSIWVSPRLRVRVLRRSGVVAGRALIRDGLRVLGPGLNIGDDVFINADCFIEAEASVTIEDGVSIGMAVQLLTVSHAIGPSAKRAGATVLKPIRIGSGAWLGARATVLPGVHVGDGAIVGAGALVTANVPANVMVAGVPARVIKHLE